MKKVEESQTAPRGERARNEQLVLPGLLPDACGAPVVQCVRSDVEEIARIGKELRHRMLIFASGVCLLALAISALAFSISKGISWNSIAFLEWFGTSSTGFTDDVIAMSLGSAAAAITLWIAVALALPVNVPQQSTRTRAHRVWLDGVVTWTMMGAATIEVLLAPIALSRNGMLGLALTVGPAALLCAIAPTTEVRSDIRSLEVERLQNYADRVDAELARQPRAESFRITRFRTLVLLRLAAPRGLSWKLGAGAACFVAVAIFYDGTPNSVPRLVLASVLAGYVVRVWSAVSIDALVALRARVFARGVSEAAGPLLCFLAAFSWPTVFAGLIQAAGGRSYLVILMPFACFFLPIVYAISAHRSKPLRRTRSAWLSFERDRLREDIDYQKTEALTATK